MEEMFGCVVFDVDFVFFFLFLVWCIQCGLWVEVEVDGVYYYLYVVLWLYEVVYYVEGVDCLVIVCYEVGDDGVIWMFVWCQYIGMFGFQCEIVVVIVECNVGVWYYQF